MNITEDFDVNCPHCLDTGEYFDGKKMVVCRCKEGKKIKKDDDKKGVADLPESESA